MGVHSSLNRTLHHVACQITMPDLMMNVHTCVIILHYLHHIVCQITMSDLMMNEHTRVTDNTT
jgi:hypothetical protein